MERAGVRCADRRAADAVTEGPGGPEQALKHFANLAADTAVASSKTRSQSKLVAGTEFDALCPERRTFEQRFGTCRARQRRARAERGVADEIKRGVDLVAGAHDVAEVDDVVADEEANPARYRITQLQLGFRQHCELVTGLLTDVGRLRKDAAWGCSRRDAKTRTGNHGISVDGHGLIIVAERHFGDRRTVKLAELLFRLHAQLRAEELIPGREIVGGGEAGRASRRQQGFGGGNRKTFPQVEITKAGDDRYAEPRRAIGTIEAIAFDAPELERGTDHLAAGGKAGIGQHKRR